MSDIHIVVPDPTSAEIEAMQPRIDAFIFPSIPRTQDEITAYNKAVTLQIAHEKTLINNIGNADLPQGTTSFSIGEFQMSFDGGSFDGSLSKKTICPSAYGVLLRAGLLYKGVEGR